MRGAIVLNICFYVAMALYSAIAIPLLSLAVIVARPFCNHRRAMYLFRRCITLYGKGIVLGLAYPLVKVQYRNTAADAVGPCVYVCNHRSSSDAFMMSLLNGEIVQVVNKWPFRLPVWGPFAKLAGYINVRAMSFDEFKGTIIKHLDDNTSIAAFPEGTRSGSTRVGQFHGALFRACLEAKATIVPVCIMGNEDKPPRGSLLLHPGIIRVHQLPGVTYEEYGAMTPFALKHHIRNLIQEYISKVEG